MPLAAAAPPFPKENEMTALAFRPKTSEPVRPAPKRAAQCCEIPRWCPPVQ